MSQHSAAEALFLACKRAHAEGRDGRAPTVPLPDWLASAPISRQALVNAFCAIEASLLLIGDNLSSIADRIASRSGARTIADFQAGSEFDPELGSSEKQERLLPDALSTARALMELDLDSRGALAAGADLPAQVHRLLTHAAGQSPTLVTPPDIARLMLSLCGTSSGVQVLQLDGAGLYLASRMEANTSLLSLHAFFESIAPKKWVSGLDPRGDWLFGSQAPDLASRAFENLALGLEDSGMGTKALLINAANQRRPFGHRAPTQGSFTLPMDPILSGFPGRVVVLVKSDTLSGERISMMETLRYCEGRGLKQVIALPQGVLGTSSSSHLIMVFDRAAPQSGIEFIDIPNSPLFVQKATSGFGHARRSRSLTSEATRGVQDGWPRHKRMVEALEFEDSSQHRKSRSFEARKLFKRDPFRDVRRMFTMAPLMKVANVFRSVHLSNSGEGDPVEYIELSVSDIDEFGEVRVKQDAFRSCDSSSLARIRGQQLESGDVVVCFRGALDTLGRVGLIRECPKLPWIPNQSFVIVRLKDRYGPITPELLRWWMRTQVAAEYIQDHAIAQGVPRLSTTDLQELLVPIGPISQIERITTLLAEHERLVEQRKAIESRLREMSPDSWLRCDI